METVMEPLLVFVWPSPHDRYVTVTCGIAGGPPCGLYAFVCSPPVESLLGFCPELSVCPCCWLLSTLRQVFSLLTEARGWDTKVESWENTPIYSVAAGRSPVPAWALRLWPCHCGDLWDAVHPSSAQGEAGAMVPDFLLPLFLGINECVLWVCSDIYYLIGHRFSGTFVSTSVAFRWEEDSVCCAHCVILSAKRSAWLASL